MKEVLIFILGVFAGLLSFSFWTDSQGEGINFFDKPSKSRFGELKQKLGEGINFFDKPSKIFDFNEVKVFQSLNCGKHNNAALVHPSSAFSDEDLVLLLVNEDGQMYYDEQVIKSKKGFRQVGVYTYKTKVEYFKTVPVVVEEK